MFDMLKKIKDKRSVQANKVGAFTGHRPQNLPWRFDETDTRCIALKAALDKQIKQLVDAGVTTWLSGMALGVDCWAAQAVLKLREKNSAVRLFCILPCKNQAVRWNASSQETYHSILTQSDFNLYVSETYTDTCMHERNHILVASSDLLLAVFDGRQKSGTLSTVNYARQEGREILILDPITLKATHEKNTPLVHYL